jgi:hypothetical protein
MNDQPSDSREVINTSGGPAIQGNVNTGGGDFAGGDQTKYILGDEGHGDKIGRNKMSAGDVTNSTVAIGPGAFAQNVKNFFFGEHEDVIRQRNRRTMLQLVKSTWFAPTARTLTELYAKGQTIHWLSWLAGRMVQYGQTLFLLEQIQPSWAQTTRLSNFVFAAAMLM